MLTDELEHRIGTSRSLSSVEIKQSEREELEQLTKEFIESGGEIDIVAPSVYSEYANNLNYHSPMRKENRAKGWSNHGIAKNFKLQSPQ